MAKKVDNAGDLPRIIGELAPGTQVQLGLWRDRKAKDVSVVLGEQAGEGKISADKSGEANSSKLGITARPLSGQEAARLGVSGGLVVENTSGPAAKAGLQAGDVILGINNQAVGSIEQFRKQLDGAGKRFALLVQRGGNRIFVPVRIE